MPKDTTRHEDRTEAPDPQAAPDDARGETSELDAMRAERDDAVAARQRALADLVNFQRRASENESRALQAGAARMARALLPVLDNFDLALSQDMQQVTVDQLLGGVRLVHEELLKALEANGVQPIRPEVGAAFDPNRHEAVMQRAVDDVAPGHIVQVMQAGYGLGEMVLRPAQVAVAPPE